MEEFFREVARLFRDYKELIAELHADYEARAAAGKYSIAYLNGLQAENDEKISQEHEKIIRRISGIREEFETDLLIKYDFERRSIGSKLQEILNSGIKLTDVELLRMAEKHKGNLTESRLLHDYAEDKGYTLRNYISMEECLQNFDNYAMHIRNSMDTGNFLPMYLNADEAEMAAGEYCAKCMKVPMDIFKTPKSADEELVQAVMDNSGGEISEEQDKAFIESFTGRKKEEPKPEDDLTEREKADARHMSLGNGNKGEITQAEIDYIHSPDYAKMREELEEEKKAQKAKKKGEEEGEDEEEGKKRQKAKRKGSRK